MIRIIEGKITIYNRNEFLNKLKKTGEDKDIIFQALDADKLAGKEHVEFAVEKAMRAFRTGNNTAKDLSKEIMLYAAGTRQISKAMGMGIHEGQNNIVLIAIGESQDVTGLDEIKPAHVLQYDSSKKEILMDIFNITDEEIEAVGENRIPELVLERVALVDVMK